MGALVAVRDWLTAVWPWLRRMLHRLGAVVPRWSGVSAVAATWPSPALAAWLRGPCGARVVRPIGTYSAAEVAQIRREWDLALLADPARLGGRPVGLVEQGRVVVLTPRWG